MRILSIDPGTNFIGLAVLDIHPAFNDKPITVQTCTSINIEIFANTLYGNTVVPIHGLRQAKVLACRNLISNMLNTWHPDVVVCESPYMGKFPQAFSALVECIQLIKLAVIDYDIEIPFVSYDPSTVKKTVGSSKINSDKNNVLNAMEIHAKELIDFKHLDEHAVDALAVGWTYYIKYRTKVGTI